MQVCHVQEQISSIMLQLAASHQAASILLPTASWPEHCSEEPRTGLLSMGVH